MTRLIDADYVKEHMRASELNGRRLHIMELEERLAVIDEVPTVDAIPIEWIEAQIEEAGYSGYDMHAYELATMLEEWKAERKDDE